jgi:acetoacetyl-[acyl-carrier protein] synthase
MKKPALRRFFSASSATACCIFTPANGILTTQGYGLPPGSPIKWPTGHDPCPTRNPGEKGVSRLPVVVGFGGINAAGRSSFHQGYRRLVLDALGQTKQSQTLTDLAHLMRLENPSPAQQAFIRRHTLVRRIEQQYFDVDAVPLQHRMHISGDQLSFRLRKRDLPLQIPTHWQVQPLSDTDVSVTVSDGMEILVPDAHPLAVSSAGQLPTGFDPSLYYPARHHPRALQMTVFGASDALHSTGIPWDELRQKIAPDRIAVYASSAHGQLDDYGVGGMLKSAWQGKRNSAKQCPLGFAEMPADFINAYILGSVGATAGVLGACATFLYNLERAVTDIREGRIDFALIGATEAPILPEVMEGYRAMGALGEDAKLLELDKTKGITEVDNTRATRPFGYNAGFTMAEAAQFTVITSDSLALELGLPMHGSVPGIFVHADGYKKSISAPGIGNYFSLGKAVHLAREMLGEEKIRRQTYVQAHGTGTPQNRVTESHVFDSIAGAFGIEDWLVSSIKCYVGHSLGAAAGDQFMAALGTWSEGYIPGIFTLDEIAHDVNRQHLRFSQQHVETGREGMAACFINSKGFGGNNASAVLLGPHETHRLLANKYGRAAIKRWEQKLEDSEASRENYRQSAESGQYQARYRFGEGVLEGHDLDINDREIRLPGLDKAVTLRSSSDFSSYREKPSPSKE